jgi:uncharacterized protein
LRIAVEDIREGVSTLESTCGSEEIGLEAEDIRFTGPVVARLKLTRTGDKVFVKGNLSIAIELECARCLNPVHRVLEGTLETQYQPLPNPVFERSEAMAQRLPDDIGIGYYSGKYIDLSDGFRESLLLELPARVLCSEDCRGLCSHCGQNLNEGKCNCCSEPDEVRTPKFADLIKMQISSK